MMGYFDLRPLASRGMASAAEEGGKDAKAPSALAASAPQYAALVVGILVQPFYDAVRAGASPSITITVATVAFALIVGALVFPGVYRASWNAERPRFVQYCTIFAAGVGWQSLVDLGKSVVTPPPAPAAQAAIHTAVTWLHTAC